MEDLKSVDTASWKAVIESQVMLVLVGLIGSGKSTFAQALERNIPQFRRCNQDELGDRQSVERLARQSLRDGLSVVVDRTNFDEAQRVHWVRIAQEVPGTKLWCIVFDSPYDVCRERLACRVEHPTIHSPERAIGLLARFHQMLVQPSEDEGFQRIFHLDLPSQSLEYSLVDLQNILMRVDLSPALASQRSIRQYFRPQPSQSEGGRGSGASRGFRGRRPFGSYRGFGAPQDAHDTKSRWRGYGRGSPMQSHMRLGPGGSGGRGSWSNAEHASSSSSFRGSRPVRDAGLWRSRAPKSANNSISQGQARQAWRSSPATAGQTYEPAEGAQ